MKKLLFIFLFFGFLFKISAKEFPITIHMTDGSMIKGYSELDLFAGDNKFKYKPTLNTKKISIMSDNIKKVVFHVEGNDVEFHRSFTKELWLFKKMEPEIWKDKIWLGLISKNEKMLLFIISDNGFKFDSKNRLIAKSSHISGRTSGEYVYYMQRIDEEYATAVSMITIGSKLIGENKIFVRSITNYLKDNPELCKKIEDKVYKQNDVIEIFEIYNQ